MLYRRGMPEALRLHGMKAFDLEPSYSSGEVPGRCIKCLAEQELDNCLRGLLRGEDSEDVWQKFQMLVTFLKSPGSRRLRDEAEARLAEGKKVRLRLFIANGKPRYELNTDEEKQDR